MSTGLRIVSICDDPSLSESRELLLKRVGYDVHPCSSWNPLSASIVQEAHIAIICRSVSEERRRAAILLFRTINGDLKILDLHATLEDGRSEFLLGGGAFLNLVENVCDVDDMRDDDK